MVLSNSVYFGVSIEGEVSSIEIGIVFCPMLLPEIAKIDEDIGHNTRTNQEEGYPEIRI